MVQSLTGSNLSSVETRARQNHNLAVGINASNIPRSATAASHADQIRNSKSPTASNWNDVLYCEAQNSLQVILSGAEILLEDHLGNLLSSQKELLTKMTHNTYHLCNLLTKLLGPEEFKLADSREKG